MDDQRTYWNVHPGQQHPSEGGNNRRTIDNVLRSWDDQLDTELTADDPLRNYQLFSVSFSAWAQCQAETNVNENKRGFDEAFQKNPRTSLKALDHKRQRGSNESDHAIRKSLPELYPSIPRQEDRRLDLRLTNPFLEPQGFLRHPSLPAKRASTPKVSVGNGYIKFKVFENLEEDQSSIRLRRARRHSTPQDGNSPQTRFAGITIAGLPPDFGRGVKLDATDHKVFNFFVGCYCEGRTLLPKNNLWLLDVAPMIAGSECVKHSILSFSSAYILDFVPKKAFQDRANLHYKQATRLIGLELEKVTSQDVGKEEALIASLMMVLGDDIVNWELRRPLGQQARWYSAARVAKTILDNSDPGYRYWKIENVQASRARVSMSNWVAFVNILADAVTPLSMHDCTSGGKIYQWLLGGTRHDINRIHGGTGLSPKLLHIFAQITYLTGKLKTDPNFALTVRAAEKIAEKLAFFHQWSDLSEGYDSADELLGHCYHNMDPSTQKVMGAAEVTDLTGQAWVATAQIYLHCRFFRRPRCHPIVKECLLRLSMCIDLMPAKGDLFTAQAPFFPIVMMALASANDVDRTVARAWFEAIVLEAGDRSSVPPVWAAVQRIWDFMDKEMIEDDAEDEKPVRERSAWWESMVDYIIKHEGYLSLV